MLEWKVYFHEEYARTKNNLFLKIETEQSYIALYMLSKETCKWGMVCCEYIRVHCESPSFENEVSDLKIKIKEFAEFITS